MYARMERIEAGTIEQSPAGLAYIERSARHGPDDRALPILNPRALDAIRQLERFGTAGLVQRVIAIFLEETPRLIDSMRRGCRESAAERLRLDAHALKGSTANVGADRLNACARRLEAACKAGFPPHAEALIAAIESSFEETVRALRRIV